MGGVPAREVWMVPPQPSRTLSSSTPQEEEVEEDVTQGFRGGAAVVWLNFYVMAGLKSLLL